MTKCKACRRKIFFLRTAKNKYMPCDVRLDKNLRRFVVGADGVDYVVTPHWATCPDADRFRRGRKN